MKIGKKSVSPSMVISSIALFIALGGTAFAALANNSVLTQHIKDGNVRRADINNAAVNSAKIQDGSLVVADMAPATVKSLKPMWAVVSNGGALIRGYGAVSALDTGASFFSVKFERNVRNCAYTATIGGTDTTYGGKGEISVYSHPVDTTAVLVVTHDSAGTLANRPFHVIVAC